MPAGPVPELAGKLAPLLGEFPEGGFGIALGGAHAKGVEDSESDLDLYVFAGAVPPDDRRTVMTERFHGDISRVVSWSGGGKFEQAGTDFYFGKTRVEIWFRSLDSIETAIAESRRGIIKREFTAWNPMGFYNYCTLSDLNVMRPLNDPGGILARWKSEIAEYPPELRGAILGQFMAQAGFWPRNFHYISAVERRDVIYCAGIAQQVIHHLIQVIFALNRTYFPGDKKLGQAMGRLPLSPADLISRIESVLLPARGPTVNDLRRQRAELVALFDDVGSLVKKYGG